MIMKTVFRKPIVMILAIISIAGLVNLSSCSDDDDEPEVADKAALVIAVDAATEMFDATEEGNNDGQFPTAARVQMQAAIDAAAAVNASTTVTQAQVNAAIVSLAQATTTFQAAQITPIAESDLIGHWTFNEGSGTTVTDISANGFVGTFKTGAASWGAGVPTWAEDRYGDVGKALHFDDGGNVEIPYNTKLNPTVAITIALWVNADVIKADNRFIGLHSWLGYKFQLEGINRPFMSIGKPDGGTYDRDSGDPNTALPIDAWHHIAASFKDGEMSFYVDGELTKTHTDTPGAAKSISATPYNLVFGQDFPTDKYAATDANYDSDKIIPLAWGGFFQGYLDEVRMYKTALTASQVKSIYDREKP
jgi:hypothetical protein